MFKNYLKTAFRNLKRNKSYAFINVLGLSVGIAACLLIFLVIRFETSFDKFHTNRENIYRVGTEFHNQDGVDYSGGIAFPVGPALKDEFSQVIMMARIFKVGDGQVSVEQNNQVKKFNEPNIFFSEPDFFKIFNFPWLTGDPQIALKDPANIAITQEIAEKYFGDWHSAVGKTIRINNKTDYKVAGIIKNIPANSDFPLDIVLPFAAMKNVGYGRNLEDWVSTFGQADCFVTVPSSYTPQKFNADLVPFLKKHKTEEYSKDRYIVQPLSEIHYDDRFGNYRGHTFTKALIKALVLIGIFLIVIACVNFINLATAQAVNRSKEVGVRKVLGGNRKQLAIQFLSETALITIAAVVLAIVFATAALPFLNDLLKLKMTLNVFTDPSLALFLLITLVAVTLLSGIYPALILSGFNPINALKNKISSKMVGGLSLRRGLVIMQFGIAHVLIIGTIIVMKQMSFFHNASLGFQKAAIFDVTLPGDSLSRTKFDFLKNKLLQDPNISSVSFSIAPPATRGNWDTDFKYDHATKNTNFSAILKWADVDYFKTYDLHFVAGRPYYPGDTVREVVVNEMLLKKLGVTDPNQAIGKQIDFWDGNKLTTIVGVIKDFNSSSLKDPLSAVILGTWKDVYNVINIKIKPGKEKEVLSYTENLWNQVYPEYVYSYQFLDDQIANFYIQEDQLSQLYKIFAAIAILISCLGLYGLVSFMAVQRTKEVGIRKVLGASSGNIVYLLSKEFSLLIIIAFAIATPIAYYFMNSWLQDFAYRINVGVTVFMMAIVSSMLVAWLAVGYRAIKAAVANPVKSLRTE